MSVYLSNGRDEEGREDFVCYVYDAVTKRDGIWWCCRYSQAWGEYQYTMNSQNEHGKRESRACDRLFFPPGLLLLNSYTSPGVQRLMFLLEEKENQELDFFTIWESFVENLKSHHIKFPSNICGSVYETSDGKVLVCNCLVAGEMITYMKKIRWKKRGRFLQFFPDARSAHQNCVVWSSCRNSYVSAAIRDEELLTFLKFCKLNDRWYREDFNFISSASPYIDESLVSCRASIDKSSIDPKFPVHAVLYVGHIRVGNQARTKDRVTYLEENKDTGALLLITTMTPLIEVEDGPPVHHWRKTHNYKITFQGNDVERANNFGVEVNEVLKMIRNFSAPTSDTVRLGLDVLLQINHKDYRTVSIIQSLIGVPAAIPIFVDCSVDLQVKLSQFPRLQEHYDLKARTTASSSLSMDAQRRFGLVQSIVDDHCGVLGVECVVLEMNAAQNNHSWLVDEGSHKGRFNMFREDMLDWDRQSLCIVTGPCGAGKTTMAKSICLQLVTSDKFVVYISARRCQLLDTYTEVKEALFIDSSLACHYEDDNLEVCAKNCRYFFSTIHSVARVMETLRTQNPLWSYSKTVLIVDEVVTMEMCDFLSGAVVRNRVALEHSLAVLYKECRAIFLCDGDFLPHVLLNSYFERRRAIQEGTDRPLPLTVYTAYSSYDPVREQGRMMVYFQEWGEFLMAVADYLRADERHTACIFVGSQQDIYPLIDLFSRVLKVVSMFEVVDVSSKNREYSFQIDEYLRKRPSRCRLLLYTTVISVGTSINTHFGLGGCFVRSPFLTTLSYRQALERVRNFKRCYVYVATREVDKSKPFFHMSYEDALKHITSRVKDGTERVYLSNLYSFAHQSVRWVAGDLFYSVCATYGYEVVKAHPKEQRWNDDLERTFELRRLTGAKLGSYLLTTLDRGEISDKDKRHTRSLYKLYGFGSEVELYGGITALLLEPGILNAVFLLRALEIEMYRAKVQGAKDAYEKEKQPGPRLTLREKWYALEETLKGAEREYRQKEVSLFYRWQGDHVQIPSVNGCAMFCSVAACALLQQQPSCVLFAHFVLPVCDRFPEYAFIDQMKNFGHFCIEEATPTNYAYLLKNRLSVDCDDMRALSRYGTVFTRFPWGSDVVNCWEMRERFSTVDQLDIIIQADSVDGRDDAMTRRREIEEFGLIDEDATDTASQRKARKKYGLSVRGEAEELEEQVLSYLRENGWLTSSQTPE